MEGGDGVGKVIGREVLGRVRGSKGERVRKVEGVGSTTYVNEEKIA